MKIYMKNHTFEQSFNNRCQRFLSLCHSKYWKKMWSKILKTDRFVLSYVIIFFIVLRSNEFPRASLKSTTTKPGVSFEGNLTERKPLVCLAFCFAVSCSKEHNKYTVVLSYLVRWDFCYVKPIFLPTECFWT